MDAHLFLFEMVPVIYSFFKIHLERHPNDVREFKYEIIKILFLIYALPIFKYFYNKVFWI